jgi:hypothetical protein
MSLSNCPCPQTGNANPIIPVTGAVVADDKYFTLILAPKGQLLLVPKGSNAQAFLTAGAGVRGFVFFEAGEVAVQPAPALTLPLLNPLSGGAHPAPPGWKYLMVGTGDPADWRMIAAPTAGSWVLQSQNGSYVLVDATSVPGINAIGASGTTTAKGGLMMLVQLTSTTYALQRLAVAHKRVVVGDIDSVTGASGYKALPDADALTHPIAQFTTLRCREFLGLDSNGNVLANGLETATVTGLGAIGDGKSVFYSTAAKRFFFRPDQTFKYTQVTTASASTAPPATWANLPSGHGAGLSLNYNYGSVRIDFQMNQATSAACQLGLFRDGVLLNTFPRSGAADYSFTFIDEANPLGARLYDVRWQSGTGSPGVARIINQSNLLVQTLGY